MPTEEILGVEEIRYLTSLQKNYMNGSALVTGMLTTDSAHFITSCTHRRRGETKMIFNKTFVVAILLLCCVARVNAGPISWATCQTACNGGYVTCMSLGGLIAGVLAPPALVGVAASCSSAQGACMALCTPILLAPTP